MYTFMCLQAKSQWIGNTLHSGAMASQMSVGAGGIGEKVQRRIQDLEKAIQRVDFVKRQLNHNSSQVISLIVFSWSNWKGKENIISH